MSCRLYHTLQQGLVGRESCHAPVLKGEVHRACLRCFLFEVAWLSWKFPQLLEDPKIGETFVDILYARPPSSPRCSLAHHSSLVYALRAFIVYCTVLGPRKHGD